MAYLSGAKNSDDYCDIEEDEQASKKLSGSLEMQFSLAEVEHGCYTLYFIIMNSPDE